MSSTRASPTRRSADAAGCASGRVGRGAGKSTFARRLGERHRAARDPSRRALLASGLGPTPDDEWRGIVTDLVAGDAWIIDGNYSGTIDVRVRAADTVRAARLRRRSRTSLVRCGGRSSTTAARCQAPGCPEHLDWEFLRWIANYRRRSRPRVLAQLEAAAPDLDVDVLRHPRDAQRFLESVTEAGD